MSMITSRRHPISLACATMMVSALSFVAASAAPADHAVDARSRALRESVDSVVPALMARDHIPGMAVAVTIDGKSYTFDYGVASIEPRVPVTNATLFEIGSVTKTFTATLASWANVRHALSLDDTTARYLPDLRGTPFGKVTLVSLGTHTPGGLPLQFPDGTMSEAQLMRYFERWHPKYPMGAYRTYTNQGIGMLGLIAARSMSEPYRTLAQQRLFPALGLHDTFIDIPSSEQDRYAWGYTDENKPIRENAGTLSDETWAVRTTASDMIRFMQENIDPSSLPAPFRQAIARTHVGYFRDGSMTQDLIWEQYDYPASQASLLDGNSYEKFFKATPVRAIRPPQPPEQNAWIDKTGSTNGFGAYVAFIPSKRLGIVLLANKNYPIPDRVRAAYRILGGLADGT